LLADTAVHVSFVPILGDDRNYRPPGVCHSWAEEARFLGNVAPDDDDYGDSRLQHDGALEMTSMWLLKMLALPVTTR